MTTHKKRGSKVQATACVHVCACVATTEVNTVTTIHTKCVYSNQMTLVDVTKLTYMCASYLSCAGVSLHNIWA